MNPPDFNFFEPRNLFRHARTALAAAALAGCFSGFVQAQTSATAAAPPTGKWAGTLAAFEAADRVNPPSNDGVLFVGSSTIRMWSSLAQDFRKVPVIINRGFGGSTMADCDHFARALVTRYRPIQVLIYAGDNDLAEGRTPQQVLASFTNFARVVRSELPSARISYISIKPSPARATLMPLIREANALLRTYVSGLGNAEYIDVFTSMLNADGQPRAELFRSDRLHMNDSGYALWQSLIASHLTAPAVSATAAEYSPAL